MSEDKIIDGEGGKFPEFTKPKPKCETCGSQLRNKDGVCICIDNAARYKKLEEELAEKRDSQ